MVILITLLYWYHSLFVTTKICMLYSHISWSHCIMFPFSYCVLPGCRHTICHSFSRSSDNQSKQVGINLIYSHSVPICSLCIFILNIPQYVPSQKSFHGYEKVDILKVSSICFFYKPRYKVTRRRIRLFKVAQCAYKRSRDNIYFGEIKPI